ncbi:Hypothetical_protein [Hexamita inflata]|uniref:Hypothetical_protein n=1 Tax=Hexamita inflata TaxID=28002 RepID=A0AA86TDC2_9EUKA|nr:Hypothetical protein HINF_LOCUS857 [Hexamita inflata]
MNVIKSFNKFNKLNFVIKIKSCTDSKVLVLDSQCALCSDLESVYNTENSSYYEEKRDMPKILDQSNHNHRRFYHCYHTQNCNHHFTKKNGICQKDSVNQTIAIAVAVPVVVIILGIIITIMIL